MAIACIDLEKALIWYVEIGYGRCWNVMEFGQA